MVLVCDSEAAKVALLRAARVNREAGQLDLRISARLTRCTAPVTRTCRSSSPQKKHSDAAGLSASSRPFRLR